jgi:regulator of replication initiation timing
MAYQRKTLRRFKPFTRQLAEIENEAEALTRRLHRLVEKAQLLELEADSWRSFEESQLSPASYAAKEWRESGLRIGKSGRVTGAQS